MSVSRSRPRIAVAGPAEATFRIAREIVAAGLPLPVVIADSPGEGTAIAAGLLGSAKAGRDLGDLEGCRAVVLSDAAALAGAALHAAASCIARLAPDAVVIVAGPGSTAAARAFHAVSRHPPRLVLSAGGLAGQRAREAEIALRLGLSRSQVGSLVVGDEGALLRPLVRYEVVGGIPAAMLVPARDRNDDGRTSSVRLPDVREHAGARPLPAARAAAILADAVLRDRRRVLSCGVHVEGAHGLPSAFATLPVIVGAGGLEGLFPLTLTLEDRSFLLRAIERIEEASRAHTR